MPRLLDITRTLRADLAVWPGDPSVQFDLRSRRIDGQWANVGNLAMSLHSGTHADAFFHYDNGGATIDALDPAIFVGPCVVLDLGRASPTTAGSRPPATVAAVRTAIARLRLDETALPPRVLLKTDAWVDETRFPHDFPGIEPALATWLGEHGVVLIGVDVPSVDAMGTLDMPAHLALGAARITILESLRLGDVVEGTYELIALPLKIAGADGSPVRAVLIEG